MKSNIAEEKLVKLGETLTGNADGNPEPSLLVEEGVETRRRVCKKCGKDIPANSYYTRPTNRSLHKGIVQAQRKLWDNLTIYGISAFGLSKQLKIDKNEAQELLNNFFHTFKNIASFLKSMEKEGLKLQRAISPLDGRIRFLSNVDWADWRKSGHALNIFKNHPIQGASASITKLALVILQNYIFDNNLDAKIIAVIHDEILISCYKNIAEKMAKKVEESMIKAFNYYCPDVPMTVEAIIDNHWIH